MSIVAGRPDAAPDTKYFLIFLSLVSGKPPSLEVVQRHAAHLAELDRDGKFVLGGHIPERMGGLIVLRAASLAEAKTIADQDPFVAGGYQTYELGTLDLSTRQNGYLPNIQPEPHK